MPLPNTFALWSLNVSSLSENLQCVVIGIVAPLAGIVVWKVIDFADKAGRRWLRQRPAATESTGQWTGTN